MDAPPSTALRARDLPAAVWRLEAGSLLNAIGSGFVLPFSFIYFHDVRGFSLGVSGLITATYSFAPLLGTPGVGRRDLDRRRGRVPGHRPRRRGP